MHKNKCDFTRFTNKTMFLSNANQAVMWEKKQNTSCCHLLLLDCFCKSCSVVSIAVGSFGKGISRQTLEQGHSTGGPQSITSLRKKYVQGTCMPWIVVHKVAKQAWAIRKKEKKETQQQKQSTETATSIAALTSVYEGAMRYPQL